MVLTLTSKGENPNPYVTRDPEYLESAHSGTQRFLKFAKNQGNKKYPTMKMAMQLYRSNSAHEMWNLCRSILDKLEISYAQKEVSCEDFFCVCILYMINRGSKIAKETALGDSYNITATPVVSLQNKGKKRTIFPKIKTLEFLFDMIKTNSRTFDPVEKINDVTGEVGAHNSNYYGYKHSFDLMDYVEKCLFEGTLPRKNRYSLEDVDLTIPVVFEKITTSEYLSNNIQKKNYTEEYSENLSSKDKGKKRLKKDSLFKNRKRSRKNLEDSVDSDYSEYLPS